MPRTCKACAHPTRAEIDRAILAGEPNRRIASRCGVSEAAIRRHAAHVSETVALAVRAEEVTRADDLLGLLREAVTDARRLRDKAEAERDFRGAIGAVKVLCDTVEKLADVGERLAKSGAAEPRTLADFMAKVAREARAGGPDAPLRVEWVNDWREPGGPRPGEPAA